MSSEFTIFAGTANPSLAAAIAGELGTSVGSCDIERFPDGEVMVELREPVRRKEVFLVQPTSPPVNDHLLELLAMADACRRAAAASITAIVPYFGYGRADKRQGHRGPITGRLVADLLQVVGISHVITVDLHTPQIEGFFHIPVDSLTAAPALCHALESRVSPDLVIVSTDAGRVQMAAGYAKCLGLPVIMLHKRRQSGTQTEVTHIVGDVSCRSCLIVDDIVATGGTLAESIGALLRAGARPAIMVAATHGLLLPGAKEKLDHPAVQEVFVSDTVRVVEQDWPRLRVISIAPLIARAMKRLLGNDSLDGLCGARESARQREETHEATILS